jgi:spermidine synthase
MILIAFGLSGAAALIYEVTWTRALSLVMGSTTYALSTMLSTFMAGLAIGAFIGGRLADRKKNLIMLFGLLELGIGIFGLITVPLINSLPPVYFKVFRAYHPSPSLYFVFQFFLCAGIMLIPTTLMGATFPVVSKKITARMDVMGRSVGSAYSFNTLGAIIGSFSAGFLLIPFAGVKMATVIAAFLNVAVAFSMIVLSKARLKGIVIAVSIILFAAPLIAAVLSKEEKSTINYYKAERFKTYNEFLTFRNSNIFLFNRDYREGRVKLWRDRNGFLILEVGGKIEGTAPEDMANTLLLSYLPIASHQGAESFLTIGLGTGVTLSAAKDYVSNLYLVEINKGVIDALRTFGIPGLLNNVDVKINDARNYLLLTEKKFDIISAEPSYPTEASTGNLFTREFYEIAASRLNTGGIYCQWLPYYQLSNDDVTMMVRTFGSVFEHVHLWKVKHSYDLILVGSEVPFIFNAEEIKKRTMELNKSGVELPFVLSRGPEQVREIVKQRLDIPLNTDDRPVLEFHAARNLITGVQD